jgi:hypothetical protein
LQIPTKELQTLSFPYIKSDGQVDDFPVQYSVASQTPLEFLQITFELANKQLDVQQIPPSHCSFPLTIPSPHLEQLHIILQVWQLHVSDIDPVVLNPVVDPLLGIPEDPYCDFTEAIIKNNIINKNFIL